MQWRDQGREVEREIPGVDNDVVASLTALLFQMSFPQKTWNNKNHKASSRTKAKRKDEKRLKPSMYE